MLRSFTFTQQTRSFVNLGALLLAFVAPVALFAQEQGSPQIVESIVGCREKPAHLVSVSLKVLSAWIENNTLFATISVTNDANSDVRFPADNPGGHYWDAAVYDSKGEPIAYCGGVSELNLDPLVELIAERDVVIVKPGQTITLSRIALAPFWPYLLEPDYDAQSFAVFYTGWSNIVVRMYAADSDQLKTALRNASRRQCNLYGGELQSARHAVPRTAG